MAGAIVDAGHEVVAYDLLGTDESDLADDGFEKDAQGAALCGLLQALDIDTAGSPSLVTTWVGW